MASVQTEAAIQPLARIKKVVQADSFIKIFIKSQPTEQTCPCCGTKTKRIHDYRLQEVQDTPLQGKQVILVLRKRRYLCPSCHKRFTEPYSFLPSYHRRTRRLAFYIVSLLRRTFSMKQIAELTGVSVQTVCRLPQALSIDEFKGMLSPANISASWLIRKNGGSSISFQTESRANWLIIGAAFHVKSA